MGFTWQEARPVVSELVREPVMFHRDPRAEYVNPAAQDYTKVINTQFQMITGFYPTLTGKPANVADNPVGKGVSPNTVVPRPTLPTAYYVAKAQSPGMLMCKN